MYSNYIIYPEIKMSEEIKRTSSNSQTPSSSSSSSSSSLSTSSYFFMPRPLIDSVMKQQQQQQHQPPPTQKTKSSMRTCNLRNESLWRDSRQNPFLSSIILTNTKNTTTGVNNHVNWLNVQQPGGFLGNNFMKSKYL